MLGRNISGFHLPPLHVKHLLDVVKLVAVFVAIAANLLAERFGGQTFGNLEIEAGWFDSIDSAEAHFWGLKLEARLSFTSEVAHMN